MDCFPVWATEPQMYSLSGHSFFTAFVILIGPRTGIQYVLRLPVPTTQSKSVGDRPIVQSVASNGSMAISPGKLRSTMEDTHQPIEELDPLVVRTPADETGGEYVRFELTLYPDGAESPRDTELSHDRWSIDFPTEHVHPHQDERWEVLVGELGVEYADREESLSAGDAITLPSGVPHRIWNPLDEPSRVALEFHPAHEAQPLTETLFVLAQRGDVDEKGHLKLLQFAVTQAAHPEHLYLTSIPIVLQRILVALLAPIGRLVGYRPTYSLESLDRTG